MENKRIFVFVVVLALLVSMSGLVFAGANDKTNVAVKELSVSEVDGVYFITTVLENKFGHGDAEVSYGGIIEGPSQGSGFGTCCLILEPNSNRGNGYTFVQELNPSEPGEYTITANVYPTNKTDVNSRDNTKTITFTVE